MQINLKNKNFDMEQLNLPLPCTGIFNRDIKGDKKWEIEWWHFLVKLIYSL
jgi:hypothetical protein